MAFENTNPWAAHFAAEAAQKKAQRAKATAKAAATRSYKLAKPEAITNLEKAWFMRYGKLASWDDRTANGLTTFVLDWLAFYGYYGARINIGGIMMPDGNWRTSGSTKGVADVIACIAGRFCQFEIKAGKDRPREAQILQQELTRTAGGYYEFVHNADEFTAKAQAIAAAARQLPN